MENAESTSAEPRRVALIGSTGSIGTQTLQVVEHYPERFRIVALAAGRNVDLLEEQVLRHRPEVAALYDEAAAAELRRRLEGQKVKIVSGQEGLELAASWGTADISVISVVGAVGIGPTIAAIRARKRVALANKETLVAAGEVVMAEVDKASAELIPVDSEHSAVYQCLRGGRTEHVTSIILTASGGPFRKTPIEELRKVTPSQALKHPNWNMGGKITIDSATLMNKGLEVIEAHWLFGVEYEKIQVLVHPQSIVHSMVEFRDGALLAQMGEPDMRIPIQYALGFPERLPGYGRLELDKVGTLSFEPVDNERFPALSLARRAGETGGTMPAVMNAANEVAVYAFLEGRIGFTDIALIVEQVMEKHNPVMKPDIGTIVESDLQARKMASALTGS